MRTQAAAFAFVVLAATAGAQQGTMVYVANGETPENVQELATIVRVIGGLAQVSIDTEKSAVAVGGTPGQIALVQWLAGELTKPAAGPPPVNSAAHEYRMPGGGDGVVRVFFLSRTATPHELQEIATIVRTIADLSRVMTYTAQRAVTVRGTAGQVESAAWLIDEIGKAAALTSVPTGPLEYRVPGGADDMIRLLCVNRAMSPQSLQEIATLIRTIAAIPRVFTYTTLPALTIRGTAAQMELSAWLIGQMDKSVQSESHEYRVPGADDGVVRVFYLAPSETLQNLQRAATSVRTAANVRRVFTYSDRRAVVMRGTSDQVAVAERVIQEAR